MKQLLGLVGGFVVSLGMFVGGLAVALFLVTAEPVRQPGASVDLTDVWTEQPRKVNKAAQDFERVPALPSNSNPPSEAQMAGEGDTDPASPPVDSIATASVSTAASKDPGQLTFADQLPAAHVEWCANRYQSYRPEDNSYSPYSGGQRPCVSPYSNEFAAAAERVSSSPSDADSYAELADDSSSLLLQYASDEGEGGTYANSDHVMYCFSRYRSYRPEDNTYQPYGGGPRRQCR